MLRRARLCVVMVCAVLLVVGGWSWPALSADALAVAVDAQTGNAHDHSPGLGQENDAAAATCCALACAPVVLNADSPARVRLLSSGPVAPLLARSVLNYRGEPPFHPPRRA